MRCNLWGNLFKDVSSNNSASRPSWDSAGVARERKGKATNFTWADSNLIFNLGRHKLNWFRRRSLFQIASLAGVFRGARISSLPRNMMNYHTKNACQGWLYCMSRFNFKSKSEKLCAFRLDNVIKIYTFGSAQCEVRRLNYRRSTTVFPSWAWRSNKHVPRAEPASRLIRFTTCADVSPGGDVCASATYVSLGETSPAARNEERGLFSQARVTGAALLVHNRRSHPSISDCILLHHIFNNQTKVPVLYLWPRSRRTIGEL